MSMIQVNTMHIMVIGPLLTYIGYNKENTTDMYFNALGGITLLLPFIIRLPDGFDYHSLINSSHLLIYIPLFLYIAYTKQDLNTNLFGLLFGAGIIVIIIHIYLLISKLVEKEDERYKY